MAKIKVRTLVIHNIVSPHVTSLFQEFSKLVDLNILYCSRAEENRSWNRKPTGFKYKILPNIAIKLRGKDLFTYFINPTIIKEIRNINPEVIILAGWDLYAYQLAFLYGKIKGIKVILWSGSTDYEQSWRRLLSLPLVRLIIHGSDAFIAYGIRAKDYLIKNGAAPQKIFIYNHTTNIVKYKIIKHSRKLDKVILYYGQLIERKGIDILIRAFADLKNKGWRLLIVGSGYYKSNLLRLAKSLELENKINIIEDPGDKRISRFYSNVDLLVLPSREEVWGLVVNEAMAAGLPVVVSDVAGSSVDLLQNGVNGYTFKTGSVSDLRAKIDNIIGNTKEMKRMGKASLGIVNSFTPYNSAKIMAEAIDYVIGS